MSSSQRKQSIKVSQLAKKFEANSNNKPQDFISPRKLIQSPRKQTTINSSAFKTRTQNDIQGGIQTDTQTPQLSPSPKLTSKPSQRNHENEIERNQHDYVSNDVGEVKEASRFLYKRDSRTKSYADALKNYSSKFNNENSTEINRNETNSIAGNKNNNEMKPGNDLNGTSTMITICGAGNQLPSNEMADQKKRNRHFHRKTKSDQLSPIEEIYVADHLRSIHDIQSISMEHIKTFSKHIENSIQKLLIDQESRYEKFINSHMSNMTAGKNEDPGLNGFMDQLWKDFKHLVQQQHVFIQNMLKEQHNKLIEQLQHSIQSSVKLELSHSFSPIIESCTKEYAKFNHAIIQIKDYQKTQSELWNEEKISTLFRDCIMNELKGIKDQLNDVQDKQNQYEISMKSFEYLDSSFSNLSNTLQLISDYQNNIVKDMDNIMESIDDEDDPKSTSEGMDKHLNAKADASEKKTESQSLDVEQQSTNFDEARNVNQSISLNVGGEVYHTKLGTLQSKNLKHENDKNNYFDTLIEETKKQATGTKQPFNIEIDRDGKCFRYLLNYLRSAGNEEEVAFPEKKQILRELIIECRFYGLKELEGILKKRL